MQSLLWIAVLTVGGLSGSGQSPAESSSFLTQRRINEFAAALDHAVRTLVEDTGLRQPRERLPAYLRRIAVPLANEGPSAYRKRIESYLRAFEKAAQVTKPIRQTPRLQDTSPANQTLWEQTVRSARLLPDRVEKLRAVWKRERLRLAEAQEASALGQEFYRTLQPTLTAREGLRDARP